MRDPKEQDEISKEMEDNTRDRAKNNPSRDEIEYWNKWRARKISDLEKLRRKVEELRYNDMYNEAYCGICSRHGVYVTPSVFDMCYDCQQKHVNPACVTGIHNPRAIGYCVYCGKFPRIRFLTNISTLCVRLCKKCDTLRAKSMRKYHESGGEQMLNPMWKAVKKLHGMPKEEYCRPNVQVLKAAIKRWPAVKRIAPVELAQMVKRQEEIDRARYKIERK